MRCLVALLLCMLGCRGDDPTPAPAGAVAPAGSASAATAPPRLIALTPSATEVVAALGAASLLVGVDEYSTYPPEVTRLPKIGSFLTPNLELIVRLAPSLVIVDDIHASSSGALHDAGIQTVACPIHALPDVKRALRTVGARLGRSAEAERVVAEIEAAMDAARARQPARRPRVLAVIDREAGGLGSLVGVGPGSWIDELLATVGAENVLVASGMRYPKLSLEEVLRARPEVILDLSFAARAEVDAWRKLDVPATKAGRVIAASEPYLIAPSPRVAAALDRLATALAPR